LVTPTATADMSSRLALNAKRQQLVRELRARRNRRANDTGMQMDTKTSGEGDRGQALARVYRHVMQTASPCENKVGVSNQETTGKYEPTTHVCIGVLPKDRSDCVVYSFGINYEWAFDDILLQLGCKVYSFDPSMTTRGPVKMRGPNHVFELVGIGTETGWSTGNTSTLYNSKGAAPGLKFGEHEPFKISTLPDLMQKFGHSHLSIVRMDVEGSEFPVLQQWAHEGWFKLFDQLLLEVHMRPYHTPTSPAVWLEGFLGAHTAGFRIFHRERNKNGRTAIFKEMTGIYELGYIRPGG
jgi:FkbM family methyltransferase